MVKNDQQFYTTIVCDLGSLPEKNHFENKLLIFSDYFRQIKEAKICKNSLDKNKI